ncbi:MAG TPA: hypothetical protein VH143_22900 [Kofleriaceae bacterium]|jgi:hypothetical protein|nr:hypothetical protein [Kofleriaceae bacterium]
MKRDVDYMEHADGEAETELDATGRAKVAAVRELGELVRGRLEQAADDLPEARLAQMWGQIDRSIAPVAPKPRVKWFERYRGYVLTAAISAGAVAALAVMLRGTPAQNQTAAGALVPVVHRPSEIEELDTPGGNGTVFNLADEDGNTTVIWVTPNDSVDSQ